MSPARKSVTKARRKASTARGPERPAIPQPYLGRLEAVRDELKKRKLDSYIVQFMPDQRWLTGFTGEDGLALVTSDAVRLLTDGRFSETADVEAPWAVKVLRQNRGPEETAKAIKEAKVRRVGFEPRHMNVHGLMALAKLVKGAKLEPASEVVAPLRQIKDQSEIGYTLGAVRVAQQAFERVLKLIKVGMREREIAAYLDFVMRDLGADGSAFETIVAIGPNSSLPHHLPGDRRVQMGSHILLDWGARVRGYVSDLTRVVWVGSIPDQLARIHRVVEAAHDKAIAAVKPGVTAGAIDQVARSHIKKAGFEKQFSHSTGHGIGLQIHEGPGLRRQAKEKLRPGMIVTIEPGIYLPGVGGVRLEDDVLVTEKGREVLSSLPLEYQILGA